MTEGILYISYDGMSEPLGQSQVLAYLERLAPGRRIHLVSFEKPKDWSDRLRRCALASRMADAGIEWHPLRYHKSPTAAATAYDIAAGTVRAIWIARRNGLGIVHARSYVAAWIALAVTRATGAKFLFDMRGLWADERVDGGLWPRGGGLYRLAKALERRLLLSADHVVTLTHASEAEIRTFDYLRRKAPPISVIPTCADLDRFTFQEPSRREPFTLGYVGSVGTWYLLDELLNCFRLLRKIRPDARMLMVNQAEQQMIRERAKSLEIDNSVIEITAAEHRDMPSLIGRMTAGTALYRSSYSRIACAPTKLAEYLGCGIPVLGSKGVGDMAAILDSRGIGVTLKDNSEQASRVAVQRLVELCQAPGIQQRCRETAIELFSLDRGVDAYACIYHKLGARTPLEGQLAGQR